MDSPIDKAFQAIPRRNFLPDDVAGQADVDAPMSIGFGQTNSQPTTVAMMLEWLEVEPGRKVLDVGSGSDWTTALLAYLAGPKGKVVAVEAVPELVKFGRDNCSRLDIKNVEFHLAGDDYGWPSSAPYDRILVSAAAQTVPPELLNQLDVGGRLVIPVKNSIFVIDKDTAGALTRREYPGFVFVPLV